MAKFDKESISQKYLFGMTLLHVHAHYICIVCAKYQKASVIALDKLISSCMHHLSTSPI